MLRPFGACRLVVAWRSLRQIKGRCLDPGCGMPLSCVTGVPARGVGLPVGSVDSHASISDSPRVTIGLTGFP